MSNGRRLTAEEAENLLIGKYDATDGDMKRALRTIIDLTKALGDARADYDSLEYDAAKVASEWDQLALRSQYNVAYEARQLAAALKSMSGNGRDGWADAALKRRAK